MKHRSCRYVIAVALIGSLLSAPAVEAAFFPFTNSIPVILTIHIDGTPGLDGNGNYNNVATYHWGRTGAVEPLGASPHLTFSRTVDPTTTTLMQAAMKHQTAATADLKAIANNGEDQTAILTYHMVNVRFDSLDQHAENSLLFSSAPPPLEDVTLTFQELDFTFQPVGADGRPDGLAQTFTWTFK